MSNHPAMHLDDFLEQRIVEDEQRARAALEKLPLEDPLLMETVTTASARQDGGCTPRQP